MKHNVKGQIKLDYDRNRDEYLLFSREDEDDVWGLVCGAVCQRRAGQTEEDDPQYIHHHILDRIKDFIIMGYKMVW